MSFAKPQILVVEDNYLMARTVCDLVRDCGFDVAGAVGRIDTGKQFLEKNDVDGAIVDINLDGKPAFEICDELSRRNVPFFFLTGYERTAIPDSYRKTRLLTKPVEMREFRSALISLAPHRPLSPEKRVAVASTRGNRLLEGIGEEAWQAMHPYLEPVELEPDKTIERRGTPAGYVYFPTSGLCAVFGHAHGQKIELALVGTDELVGTSGVLGRPDAALETVVQLPTSAWRIASSDLAALLDQHADLRVELTTYVDALIRQIAASAVTIGHASVEQRVARWLSLVAERSGLDRIEVTHEAMGRALAVRRAGITVALHELEARGAVKSMRKLVRILDREKLAKLAGPFDPSKT